VAFAEGGDPETVAVDVAHEGRGGEA